MNCLRDLLLFCHLFQIGFRWCLGHDDGRMGDIGFKCPSGSVFYQGYCFRKETVPMTWKHAETACLRSGMYLAWLEDAIENEYVATHVMSDVNQFWIGLSNTSSTAGQNEVSWTRYRISDDKTIPVYKGLWKNLQPADFIEENKCVSTLKDKYDNHWTVTNCRKKLPFVCKLMGAPKPHDVILCGNGGYIHKNWKCDGQNDCGDMSDEIDCSSSCSELLMLEKGTPGSITMTSFDNNAFCTWTIQAPVGDRIKITISSSFHLEENADVLSIWTGGVSLKMSTFLGSVTGSLQSQKKFYSQNNYIIMQLSMDGSVNVRSGFTVTYETVADSVIWNDMKKLTAGSSWQHLESPLYGTAVPFGLQLEWLITAGSYQVVTLEFLEVDLPTSSSLQVYDGEDLMASQVFTLNKNPLHPIYISRSKSVRVVLSTDEHEYTKYRGFHLKYKEGCNIEMNQQGTIYSPGYKVGSYPSNVICAWILTRNTGEAKPISLRFTEFKVKSNSDYVELYNDTAGTALHTGSGLTGTSDITEIFSSTNGYLNVTFKSNLVLVEKGFKAEFSVDCPILTLSQWTINSVTQKYTSLNTEIKLSCQPGYSFKQEEYNSANSVALKCLPGGKWNVSRIPDCQITYCGIPPAIQNGIIISTTGAKVGDNVSYKCYTGFTLGGSSTTRCQENGHWDIPPMCYSQQCSTISYLTNGNVNITEGSGTDFASVLMFSCDPGYDLLGSVYIHCRSNGTWSHSKPSCTEINCPIPHVIFGRVDSDGDVKYKEIAKLKCDAGFILNCTTLSEKNVTCGSDALFSGLDPCVRRDFGENRNDCPGYCNMTYTAETFDKIDECECICTAGYTGINCTEKVNECASYPCKHGATCTDRVNDYYCNCPEGWTGKNCDQQIDYCTTTFNKCQSGKCFNLIDDKYCRCSPGTRGNTCEDIPDVCNIINPCSTMGACRHLYGTAICSCQINYSGKSCQLLRDFCTGSTTCLYMGMPGTGGTCTNLESGGHNCQCQTGFSGATCQTKTTLCSTLNCGSIAQCNEEIGCYCPEGKILTDNKACKLPSNDFDMLFDPQIGDEGAYTTAVLNDPDNSDLSFMLWVRFNKDQKDIDNTVILKLGEFIEVKKDSITVWNTINNFVLDLTRFGQPIKMMDETKWYIIVCSWKRNGESLVVLNGVKVFEGISLPGILPKVFKVEIGKKFGGRISQVKIWANSLTINDVYQLDENKDYNPSGSTVVHGWYNYRMNKGVVKKSPTQIEKEVCDVPACSSSDKIKPKIKDCANDVTKYSADRIFAHSLPKFTDMFEDFNESLSLSSQSEGNIFTWGDYSLLFMASDDNGNTAMCHSKLYVRYNDECPAPRTSSQKDYCSVSSKDICKLECPSNQELSLPAPKYIPCSELGVYNPLKPQEKIVLPSCGNIMLTTIQIDVSMVYSLQVTCSETFERVMETKLMADFKNEIYQTWNTLCSSSDCSDVSIKPSCVPDSKQMILAIQIKSLSNEITRRSDGSEKYTPKEVLRVLIFEEDAFDAKDIGGAMILNDQVVITDTVSCPAGYMVIGDNCVACSTGSFYNSTSQNCEFCPVGSYGSSTGLKECNGCGSGKTTLGVGYTSYANCVDGCPVGKFWDGSKCSLCLKHYYQNMTGKDYCSPCPLGKKTSGMGSNSSSQCFDDCPEGKELKPDGKCVICSRGYYRSFLEDVCMECPAGNTTEGTGSTSKDSCYMTICYNGTYRNKTTNVCDPCPVGEYQPDDLQEECIKCPAKYSTESAGKNNQTDCKFYCPKGYEILSAASETCQPCSRGFYKDNSNVFGSCVSCSTGKTTEKMNSTSIESCSISKCSSGQEIDSTGGCSDCELNSYQPVNIPTSTDKCLSCKDNYGTKQKMSNKSYDCLPMCLGGRFFNQTSTMCERCPKGSWNNGNFTMKFEECVACPVKFTTTGPGMISEDNCTLLNCDPGSYISGTDCLLCDYGYYQPARHQKSCIQCGTNLNTSTQGASIQGECQLFCGAGLEGHYSCTPCKEGFVKGGSGTFMCQECTGNLTSNDARTECTELFCDKGYYSNAHQNSCMPCDIGYFKKDRGNALKCTRCPDGFLTPNIASTSAENCNEPFCIPGHYLNSGDVCVPCMIGFYKDVTGNGNCTACPAKLTTPLMGSTELSNCSIVFCNAGEKRISSNNTCMKCPLGYYQPNRGESVCIECGDGKTTEQVGTYSKTGCIPICPAGEEYVSVIKTCKECPLGSYKSEYGNNKACTPCPIAYTTGFTGSISVNNCSFPDCMPGTYRSIGGCKYCPVGTYQDLNFQESCKSCPLPKNTTETTGATSESFCIKFCLPGQQYDRNTETCQYCPKDFYTNKTISKYCIKCPIGYITYGEGSDTCVKLSVPDSGITQAPAIPVQQTYSFNLQYKATVDCNNMDIRNQIKANLLQIIRARLRELVKRFVKLCSLPEISKCFASIEVKIKNCNTATTRKRATAPSFIDVELNIPDLGETVTDTSKYVELQTEIILNEDLDTRKTEYSPAGLTLVDSVFVGKYVTCTAGYISINNNQSCAICPAGTYHDGSSNQCMNCAQNSYQDQAGKTSCIRCPGTINKYTPSLGSKSESDCVSVANDTSNNGSENFFHYYYIGVGSAIIVLVVAISVIFGRVFCRRKANKPKRYYYENPLTTGARPEDTYTGLSYSGDYATIDEMRENMNMRTFRGCTASSDIYLTPRGHRN